MYFAPNELVPWLLRNQEYAAAIGHPRNPTALQHKGFVEMIHMLI
jgi:hypothetical protein